MYDRSSSAAWFRVEFIFPITVKFVPQPSDAEWCLQHLTYVVRISIGVSPEFSSVQAISIVISSSICRIGQSSHSLRPGSITLSMPLMVSRPHSLVHHCFKQLVAAAKWATMTSVGPCCACMSRANSYGTMGYIRS